MKAINLSSVWDAPDNSRLMKKQTSVRLATHIEARISAICEMFPAKSKSQVINDLLASALDEFADGFEFEPGKERAQDYDQSGPIEIEPDVGLRHSFYVRANRFLKKYEKEIGNEEAKLFNATRWREVGEK